MQSWRRRIIEHFIRPNSPRVLTYEALLATVEDIRPGTPKAAVARLVADLDGLLFSKLTDDILLNRKSFPAPTIGDALPLLVPGAVVSLQTVLGDAGVLNNYTPNYYCIRPASLCGDEPRGGLELGEVDIQWVSMPDEIVQAGSPSDRLEYGLHYPRATPEAAVIHWLWLSLYRSSRHVGPPAESDLDNVDLETLDRLAQATGMTDVCNDWVRRAREYAENDDGFGYKPD